MLTDVIYGVLGAISLPLILRVKLDFQFLLLLKFAIYIAIAISLNYFTYENDVSLLSQLRFLAGVAVTSLLYMYFKDKDFSLIKRHYLGLVLVSSFFIILQNLSFHLFQYHFFFSFGDFDLIRNSTSSADPSSPLHMSIRSGGLFREPSWFAIFSIPAIYFLYESRRLKEFLVLATGLVLSTSSIAYFFLFSIFVHITFFSRGARTKFYACAIVSIAAIFILYWHNAPIFERLLFFLSTGGSIEPRLLTPLNYFLQNLSLSGVDTTFIKSSDGERLFFGTLLYIFFSFGLLGLLSFLSLIIPMQINAFYFVVCFLAAFLIEGMSGRIDFWILILIFILWRNATTCKTRVS